MDKTTVVGRALGDCGRERRIAVVTIHAGSTGAAGSGSCRRSRLSACLGARWGRRDRARRGSRWALRLDVECTVIELLVPGSAT